MPGISKAMIEAGARAILAKVPLGYGMTKPEADEYARACLTAALSGQVVGDDKHRPAYWTHDDGTVGHLYYFALTERTSPPYRRQRHVKAIIDVASDGTLAGVELIDDMPPPPSSSAAEPATSGSEHAK